MMRCFPNEWELLVRHNAEYVIGLLVSTFVEELEETNAYPSFPLLYCALSSFLPSLRSTITNTKALLSKHQLRDVPGMVLADIPLKQVSSNLVISSLPFPIISTPHL